MKSESNAPPGSSAPRCATCGFDRNDLVHGHDRIVVTYGVSTPTHAFKPAPSAKEPAPTSAPEGGRDPLEYVLNRMEAASQQDDPAKHGYGPARRELLDGIRSLRSRLAAAEKALAEIDAIVIVAPLIEARVHEKAARALAEIRGKP